MSQLLVRVEDRAEELPGLQRLEVEEMKEA